MEKQLYFSPTVFMVEAPFCLVAGDTEAYTLIFHAEEAAWDKMILTAERADGETVTDYAEFDGKICRYTMCNAMYEVPGPLKVNVTIQHKDTTLTSNHLSFRVLPAPKEGTIAADDRYPLLTKLILEVNDTSMRAENALNKIIDAEEKLLPETKNEQPGKILCLKQKELAELRFLFEDLENFPEYIEDAGILNQDTAFITLSRELFANKEGLNPIAEENIFGFTFIPVETDTSSDFDVIVEEVTASAYDFTFTFPLESCPLMENVTDENMFDVFQTVRISGEYYVTPVKPFWLTPEQAVSAVADEIKSYIQSEDNRYAENMEQLLHSQDAENLKVAKAYTDSVTNMPHMPKECRTANNSFYCFELCKQPVDTENILAFYYNAGSSNFDIEISTDAFQPSSEPKNAVFFNPKTGAYFVCDCTGYINFNTYYEYNFENLEKPLSVTTLADFKAMYTHCGIYSGTYKWKKEEDILGEMHQALDSILSIQEKLIGGAAA